MKKLLLIIIYVSFSCNSKKPEVRHARETVYIEVRSPQMRGASSSDIDGYGTPPLGRVSQVPTEKRRSILDRPNDYGSGASVPIAPEPQDVRKRLDAYGRYAAPQPSQRTIDYQ